LVGFAVVTSSQFKESVVDGRETEVGTIDSDLVTRVWIFNNLKPLSRFTASLDPHQMAFFTSVILRRDASSFPSIARRERVTCSTGHAPKGLIIRFLPIVVVPIQFQLFGRGAFLRNAVIRTGIVRPRTTGDALSV
jgi:hypothetical protein